MKKLHALAVVGLTAITLATAQAELMYGLTTAVGFDQGLFTFDSATPGTTTAPIAITGVSTGIIVDIDVSPVSGNLYGMASNGDLYILNRFTGAATLSIGVGSQIPANTITAPTEIDFNPAADRMRVFQGNSNFRLTPDSSAFNNGGTPGTVSSDGTFSYISGGSATPELVGAAYTNNFDGTLITSLYSIDTFTNNLAVHSGAPEFSTLTQVGSFGFDIGTFVGFDISALQGDTSGYVSDANSFFTIDLSTGALTFIGVIGSGTAFTTQSIAAVPEPSTYALLGIALVGLVVWKARRTKLA